MAGIGHQRSLNLCLYPPLQTTQINHQRIAIINCFDADWPKLLIVMNQKFKFIQFC